MYMWDFFENISNIHSKKAAFKPLTPVQLGNVADGNQTTLPLS
jgi:hypothetical protein